MRTTVILSDSLVAVAKKYSGEKTLSGLLNVCLASWIRRQSGKKLEAQLAREYREGGEESKQVSRDFASLDRKGWPKW